MKNVFLSLPALAGTLGVVPALAQTTKPNIVIIMTDQQRADICGREGFPMAVTPFADSLALKNVWFDKAYTVAPASIPARCSMFTGRYPTATHVRTNHNLNDTYFTKDMLQVFKESGYKTALVGKNHAHVNSKDMDYHDEYFHWGKNEKETEQDKEFAKFLNQDARGQYLDATPFPVEAQNPVKMVNRALAWTEKQEEPFFLWLSFPEPHNPYQISEPYFSMFSPDKIPAVRTTRKDLAKKGEKYEILAELEDASCPDLQRDLPRLRGNYLGMLRLIDDQVKRFVDGLKASGKYDNTIFVILSDHGDYCGEYGLIRKGAGVPECLTKIPMVWAGCGIKPQSGPMPAHVSLADVFPTICTAIGADIPLGVQGRSLWPMLTGKPYPKKEFASVMVEQGFGGADFTRKEPLTFEKEGALQSKVKVSHFDELNTWTQSGTERMVRKDDWKIVMDSYGRGELYNLKKDPSEINNLYGNKKYEEKQMEMLHELTTWELRVQDPLPVPRNRYVFKRNPYNYHFTE